MFHCFTASLCLVYFIFNYLLFHTNNIFKSSFSDCLLCCVFFSCRPSVWIHMCFHFYCMYFVYDFKKNKVTKKSNTLRSAREYAATFCRRHNFVLWLTICTVVQHSLNVINSIVLWFRTSISMQTGRPTARSPAVLKSLIDIMYIMTSKTSDGCPTVITGDSSTQLAASSPSPPPVIGRLRSVRLYAWPVAECCAVISRSHRCCGRRRWCCRRDPRTGLVPPAKWCAETDFRCCLGALNVIIHRWVASYAPVPALCASFAGWSLIDNV